MPMYFSIDIECSRKNIYKNIMRDFYKTLEKNGLIFKSGFMEFKKDSLEETILWNQKKLEDNFELGYSEHCSHDYKQILFDFTGLSETRMYIMNDRKKKIFIFHIIIPEEDLQVWDDGYAIYGSCKFKMILQLIENIWEQPYIDLIQTSLELSGPPSLNDIVEGEFPCAEPFAILPKNISVNNLKDEYNIYETSRAGMVLISKIYTNNKNLYYHG